MELESFRLGYLTGSIGLQIFHPGLSEPKLPWNPAMIALLLVVERLTDNASARHRLRAENLTGVMLTEFALQFSRRRMRYLGWEGFRPSAINK